MENKIPIEQLVNRNLVSVSAGAKAGVASRLIADSNVDVLPVLEEGRLVGLIREESLKGRSEEPVNALMEKPLFVEKSQDVDYAIKYMLDHHISRVPVVDSAIGMKCIGTISSSELLEAKKSQK